MSKVYIIAEAGVNHNGSLELALKLCDAAKDAGVDAVKFQTWKTEKIITKSTSKANYQTVNTGNEETQFEMLKSLEMSYDNFACIKKYCHTIGIDFLSTPDEEESLDFLISLGIPLIKIGSGEVTNIPFLRYIGSKRMPVILSTGMSNLDDVERAYNILIENGAPIVDVLHCTTNYPCPMNEVNLMAMNTIKNAIGCRVGYSDHTIGIEVSIAAVAIGAEIIEKHFTLDKNMDGPDHAASIEPLELKNMVLAIRNIEYALGDGIKRPNRSEQIISNVVLKKIVALRPIQEGELFSSLNLCVKRSENGIFAKDWDFVIGKVAIKNFSTDEPICL